MEPGQTFAGRFLLERRAGSGGMGDVYRARDGQTGEVVALKVLRAGASDARFRREIQILSELRHPRIVRYVDSGEIEGDPYLVMEWLDGEPLDRRFARGPLAVEEALALGRGVADALSAAHSCGVVHRDLKPSNVFLAGGKADDPRLLDFGVARLARAPVEMTGKGDVLGTLAYMAPEQVSGQPADGRTDLFSLAVLLYHGLAGRPPFDAAHPSALAAQVLFAEPPPLRPQRPDVPPSLAALIHQMLSKQRGERPPTAAAVARALAGMLHSPERRGGAGAVNPAAPTRRAEAIGWDLVSARAGRGAALPFLGRDRELGQLAALHEECADEPRAQAVLITAPPGMGKSRLAAELLQRLRDAGREPAILWLHGEPMSESSPLAMIAAGVRRYAGILDGEPLEAQQDKLRAAVASRVPDSDRRRVTEFLGELVRVPFPDDDRPTLRQARSHAPLMAEEMRRAFEDLIDALCSEGALAVVAEDIHWADAPSLGYLDGALRKLRDRPLFLLALARPELTEIVPELWSERNLTRIPLHELRSRTAEALVRAALPDEPEATMARLVERAAGNPFYLEELCRAVAEGRADSLPETIVAMVEDRLGALPAAAQAVLRAGSVLGEIFWLGGVAAQLGAGSWDRWLELLEDRGLIVQRAPARFPGEREYAFRHALLRDGAHAQLAGPERASAHRLAGAWLEAAGEANALVLAGHYELGEDHDRAARWCLAAAEQAFERDDLDAALAAARRGARISQAQQRGEAAIAPFARVEEMVGLRRAERGAGPPPAPMLVPDSSYRFSIVPGTQIFVEICAGRWSRELTRRYIDDFKATVAPLLGRPWGKLCNLDAWLPTEPDAAESIIEFLKWSIQEQMTFVAYVISNPGARLQARRIIESSNVAVRCGFFVTEEEGLAWLEQKGLGGRS